jgi:hypothetical protein
VKCRGERSSPVPPLVTPEEPAHPQEPGYAFPDPQAGPSSMVPGGVSQLVRYSG